MITSVSTCCSKVKAKGYFSIKSFRKKNEIVICFRTFAKIYSDKNILPAVTSLNFILNKNKARSRSKFFIMSSQMFESIF